MTRHAASVRWGLLVTVAALLALAPAAEAKIPIPINTGNEVFEVGPLPDTLKAMNKSLASWKLGYLCDRFGIIGADVWTWNCKLVAYDGTKGYSDLPDAIRGPLEKEYPMSKAQRGAWNHYGIVVLVMVVVGLGALKSAA